MWWFAWCNDVFIESLLCETKLSPDDWASLVSCLCLNKKLNDVSVKASKLTEVSNASCWCRYQDSHLVSQHVKLYPALLQNLMQTWLLFDCKEEMVKSDSGRFIQKLYHCHLVLVLQVVLLYSSLSNIWTPWPAISPWWPFDPSSPPSSRMCSCFLITPTSTLTPPQRKWKRKVAVFTPSEKIFLSSFPSIRPPCCRLLRSPAKGLD